MNNTACKNCRHLELLAPSLVRPPYWYDMLCSATPLRPIFDPYSGEEHSPQPRFAYCRDVNMGKCKKYEEKGRMEAQREEHNSWHVFPLDPPNILSIGELHGQIVLHWQDAAKGMDHAGFLIQVEKWEEKSQQYYMDHQIFRTYPPHSFFTSHETKARYRISMHAEDKQGRSSPTNTIEFTMSGRDLSKSQKD